AIIRDKHQAELQAIGAGAVNPISYIKYFKRVFKYI
ncbi:MAG: hypothetical protein CI949_2910, partial [Halanaerobium sp.]